MKKLLLILLLGMFMITLVNAAIDRPTADDTFQVDRVVNYGKACLNNGTYCSTSAFCTFTFFDPDGNVVIDNQTGTNSGAFHNLTYIFDKIGVYQIDAACCDGGLCDSDTFYAQITGSGLNENIWLFVIFFAIGVFVIIFGLSVRDPYITMFGSFIGVFLGLWVLFNGIAGIRDEVYTRAIGIILLALSGYVGIQSGLETID